MKRPRVPSAGRASPQQRPRQAAARRCQDGVAVAARLRAENRALKKSVRALMVRVEKSVDDQGSGFSWFQAAASLEEAIRQRTEQYEQLNLRLQTRARVAA